MHRLVSTVFKTLILSLLFMFLLDTSLLAVEIISIHSKVSNIAGTMQTELARNNYMPDALAETFTDFLTDIARTSSIMEESDVKTNFATLTADNAGEYGDVKELKVEMTLHPTFVYYNPDRSNGKGWLVDNPISYTLTYEYQVPCLRYLK